MTGTKHSGGKATTPEAKAAKSAAAAARWGHPPPSSAKSPANADADPAPSAMDTLDDHDAQLGLPVTWGDSLKRKQVVEQDLINARRQVELDEARIKLDLARQRLVDRSELDKTAATIRDTWATSARQIVSGVLAKLTGQSIELRTAVREAVEAEVTAAAERVAEQLKASK
jgi:hypothetical protein